MSAGSKTGNNYSTFLDCVSREFCNLKFMTGGLFKEKTVHYKGRISPYFMLGLSLDFFPTFNSWQPSSEKDA